MVKVGVATLATTIILLGIGAVYIHHNLSTYFIYCAKHVPHAEGTNPEMVFILDHLDSMGESTIEGLRYDTDGYNTIIKDETFSVSNNPFNDSAKYDVFFSQSHYTYLFDKSGKFLYYWYLDEDDEGVYEKSEARKREAQGYVDEVINHIVEKMEVKPKVNLQWLFNKKYQERFSDE